MSLPEECNTCMLRPIFCDIDVKFEQDPEIWFEKATECGQLDVLSRIKQVEVNSLNKIDRARVLDEIYPFFFDSNLLAFPAELLRRSMTEKFNEIFSEYSSDSYSYQYVKWALGVEVIQKFCQMSETLAAHLIASKNVGNNYESYEGYVDTILTYNVGDAVSFYQSVSQMSDADLIQVMCYPEPDDQEDGKAKEALESSLLELKTDLEIIGEEYIKFKEIYNSYKHGCRLLHPKNIHINGEEYEAIIMYLTKKAVFAKGGVVNFMAFPNDDFNSFFLNIENIMSIINTMLENRKERHLISKGLKEHYSIALYFSFLKDLYKDTKIEFII